MYPKERFAENFVIKYIEPLDMNLKAVGLNIAFESQRYAAAVKSRDTGKAAITKRILLVQDQEKAPGFLLLLPKYKKGFPLRNSEDRKKAFDLWIYAPFIGKNFMQSLTESQGRRLHLQVYDGEVADSDTLIYDSGASSREPHKARFVVSRKIEIMQQKWLLVWSSTPTFEKFEKTNESQLVLFVGGLFTVLCWLFLIAIGAETKDTIFGERKRYLLPFFILSISLSATWYFFEEIRDREIRYIGSLTSESADATQSKLMANLDSRILALNRMADRWRIRGGYPKTEWVQDAKNYVADQKELKAVEWVDASYHVRWVVPIRGNESAVGLNIVFDEQRKEALSNAANRTTATVTPTFGFGAGI